MLACHLFCCLFLGSPRSHEQNHERMYFLLLFALKPKARKSFVVSFFLYPDSKTQFRQADKTLKGQLHPLPVSVDCV